MFSVETQLTFLATITQEIKSCKYERDEIVEELVHYLMGQGVDL